MHRLFTQSLRSARRKWVAACVYCRSFQQLPYIMDSESSGPSVGLMRN